MARKDQSEKGTPSGSAQPRSRGKVQPTLKVIDGADADSHFAGAAKDLEELAKVKLQSSGLTLENGRRLGMSWYDEAETMTYTPGAWPLPSLRIPYFQPGASGLPMTAHPGWPPFYRIRALREPDPMPNDFRKYIQASDSGVCAYFPKIVDWTEICPNWRIPLVITEGELKAAKACLEGFPTIGLGGVNSYKASARGYDLLPSLEMIEWARRPVTIIFDSDLQTNPNVCRALQDLAETLLRRGAVPRMVLLPKNEDGTKVGLDDFLVANHRDVLRQMVEEEAVHVTIARTLWDFNDRFAQIPSMDRVVMLGEHNRGVVPLLSAAGFKNATTAAYAEQELRPDGSISTTLIPAAEAWMRWPLRQEAKALTYRPDAEPLALIKDPRRPPDAPGLPLYNTWSGWGIDPQEGDVTPFLQLVDHLFTNAEEGSKLWFLRWCAYPIQHPGAKLFSSVVVHGLEQGTGKSLIGYTLGAVYGANFSEISQADLHGNFNEWAIAKQFILGDDVTGSDKLSDRDRLKKMITQQEVRINAKNQPTYLLPDCINYMWTSNQPDSFFLEDKDRRFFVHEANVPPLQSSFYQHYIRWLWSDPLSKTPGAGAAAVHHYLKTLDLGDFNPAGKAFHTQAKAKMIRASKSGPDQFAADLFKDPDGMLGEMKGDLFPYGELVDLYKRMTNPNDPSSVKLRYDFQLAKSLSRAEFAQAHKGNSIPIDGLPRQRYWVVRNRERWANAALEDIQAHIEDTYSHLIAAEKLKQGREKQASATPKKPKKF